MAARLEELGNFQSFSGLRWGRNAVRAGCILGMLARVSRMLVLVDMAWSLISTDVPAPIEAEGGPPGAHKMPRSQSVRQWPEELGNRYALSKARGEQMRAEMRS